MSRAPTTEDFMAQLQVEMAKLRQAQLEDISFGQKAYLALPPLWTVSMALAIGFPGDDGRLLREPEELQDFLSKAQAAGLCKVSADLDRPDEELFKLPDERREEVIRDLREEIARTSSGSPLQERSSFAQVRGLVEELGSGESSSELDKIRQDLAESIRKYAKGSPAGVPVITRRWAELARAFNSEEASQRLRQELNRLLDQDVQETTEAVNWLEAGGYLIPLMGRAMESAVRLGDRRLRLFYRRSEDERQLKDFVERKEQLAAFRDLMSGPDEIWALHYMGVGGVGKTFLLRYLRSKLAPDEFDAVLSRIDFDYLSAEYPVHQPGELLLALAEQLRPQFPSRQGESALDDFYAAARVAQQVYEDDLALDVASVVARIRQEPFLGLLEDFVRLLERLGKPVILVIDTCEELAKMQPTSIVTPSIAATFAILEEVHQRLPSVRVIFAGRRLLSGSGHRWEVDLADWPAGSTLLTEHKEYLRLHPIRGFTEDESDQLFDHYETSSREIPGALRDEIRKQSIEAEHGLIEKIRQDDSSRNHDRDIRYNPLSLSVYGEWFRADPSMDAATIASGEIDPYVEVRIIQRLRQEEVRQLLPAATVLGRFNYRTLRPAFAGDETAFELAYNALAAQEWIQFRPETETQPEYLIVDNNLRPRLLRYYESPKHRLELENARASLAPALAQELSQTAIETLEIEQVDTALQSLPDEAAVSLWDTIAEKVARSARWDWALQEIPRLLYDEAGAAYRESSTLYAAVLATYTSANIHLSTDFDPTENWQKIARSSVYHPVRSTARLLRSRALAGQVAALKRRKDEPDERKEIVDRFRGSMGELLDLLSPEASVSSYQRWALASSCVAAIEYLVETAEQTGGILGFLPDLATLIAMANAIPDTGLQAFTLTLAARTTILRSQIIEERESPRPLFEQALALLADDNYTGDTTPQWPDWRSPSSLKARVAMEAARVSPVGEYAYEELMTRLRALNVESGTSDFHSLDEELLASVLLLRAGESRLIPVDELMDLGSRIAVLKRRERCNAHRQVLPYFVSLAQAWITAGLIDRARNTLSQGIKQVEQSAEGARAIDMGQEVQLRLAYRMRWSELARTLYSQSLWERQEGENFWFLALRSGLFSRDDLPPPEESWSPARYHKWWRSQYSLNREDLENARDVAQRIQSASDDGQSYEALLDNLHHSLDQVEINYLISLHQEPSAALLSRDQAEIDNPTSLQGSSAMFLSVSPELLELAQIALPAPYNITDHQRGIRVLLRTWALLDTTPNPPLPLDRTSAEIALEEGSLLALRLPYQALRLIELAQGWFVLSGDWLGGTMAAVNACQTVIQTGRDYDLGPYLERIESAYRQLTKDSQFRDFLSWQELADVAVYNYSSTRPERVLAGVPEGIEWWQGWQMRLLYCLFSDQGELLSFHNDLLQIYGPDLSPELQVTPVLPAPSKSTTEETKVRGDAGEAPPEEPQETDESDLWVIGFVVIILLLGIGLLLGGYFLVSWLLNQVTTSSVATGWKILIYGGIIGGLTAFYVGSGRLAGWLASCTRVMVTIGQPASSDSSTELVTFSAQPVTWQFRHEHFTCSWQSRVHFRKKPPTEHEDTVMMELLGPYVGVPDGIPELILNELKGLNEKLRQASLPVPLAIHPRLSPYAWEAFLKMGQVTTLGNLLSVDNLRFYRDDDQDSLLGQADLDQLWGEGRVLVVGDERWRGEIMTARNLATRNLSGRNLTAGEMTISDGVADITYADHLGKDQPGPFRILHLFGNPVRTRSSIRLQLGDPQATSFEKTASKVAPVIGSEDVPLGITYMVIVQAESAELAPRESYERQEAAYLRLFATELFSAGAPAVLVIPSLPPSLADGGLYRLARLSTRRRPTVEEVLKEVSWLRQQIINYIPAGDDGSSEWGDVQNFDDPRVELALDVSLFMRRNKETGNQEYYKNGGSR